VNLEMERGGVGMGIRKIAQWVDYDDFTDGGGAAGTLNMTETIPAHSWTIGVKAKVTTGFIGNTSCTLSVGTSTDANDFSTGSTINIYTAATVSATAVGTTTGTTPGLFLTSAATTVKLTATGNSDFTAVSAGKMFVEVFYLSTTPEFTTHYPDENRY
jgi:hypothetical protein